MPASSVLPRRVRLALRLGRDFVRFTPASRRRASAFDEIETFCTFIGYSRSGHSLVAACLDAHRHAAIAHEQKTFLYVHGRFDRRRLYALILHNTETVGHTLGWHGQRPGGYTYDVPGQWQGRFERLRVIGDKDGENATCRIDADPWLPDRLRSVVGVPVRFVHVVRNPFDNVATMARRMTRKEAFDLGGAVARYRRLAEANAAILARVGDDALTVHHGAFVDDTEGELERLCQWLGLDPSEDYLRACAGLVFEQPRKTRDTVEWPPELRADLEDLIARTDFLAGYTFDD